MLRQRTLGSMAVAVGAMGVLAGVLMSGGPASATLAIPLSGDTTGSVTAAAASPSVPILMYHYVNETPPPTGPYASGLTVSPAQFEAEMDYLAEQGFHPVTLAEVYAVATGHGRLPSRPVAITFDDGGLDGYTTAFPILLEHGFRATFFVITGYVGNGFCMTWEQLGEMHAAGMDIESHTFSHPDLRRVDSARLARELELSRSMLAERLGVDALLLAYPGGRYDGAVLAAAQNAGYGAAVTTRPPGLLFGRASCFLWPRTNIKPGLSLARFATVLAGTRKGSVR